MGPADTKGMNRRTFIKAGMVGTATALIAPPAFAEALQKMTGAEPSPFPNPVYRTLGRTGMKVSVVRALLYRLRRTATVRNRARARGGLAM